ncbi:LysM peptidoglycan-binding domain-containing protein [Salimicrobium halophilum]|uniref:LysM peptidoglycan-binding domain-containing protein n=1 Tax=Salimicrobium halophilum TaxID=86666 RepID=UPI00115FAFAC|nr:LysM peptidoglycan-binding domain-containing protein [Salimicrobium halophilum]
MANNYHIFIDESLAFPSGTGAEELVAISIQPEVSVDYSEERCKIEGKVVLQGEFVPVSLEEDYERRALPELSFVEGSHFEHHIPLEIDIPMEKVEEREEVNVDIHAFDYELPEPGRIVFHSDFEVSGVKAEEKQEPPQETIENWSTPTYYERSLQKEEVLDEEVEEETEEEIPWEETTILEADEPEEKAMPVRVEKKEPVEELEPEPEDVEVNAPPRDENAMEMEEGEVPVMEETDEKDENEEKEGKWQDIFTTVFQKRETSYSKMKLYIVQGEETLETIAEDYEVPVKDLKKWNKQKETLEAGDIIYIFS